MTTTSIPERHRREVLLQVAITAVITVAWLLTMLRTRRPALDFFCVFTMLPVALAGIWGVPSCKLIASQWRHPDLRRFTLTAVALVSLFLAPYCFLRAGADMFTLSLRYHLWRAGKPENVRTAFNQWVAIRRAEEPTSDDLFLFHRMTADRNVVPIPPGELPPLVQYMRDRFPSRFGTTSGGVAYLDNVSAFTTTEIMIGPPGWQPEGSASLMQRITGSRRKLADGIWVRFGTYAK